MTDRELRDQLMTLLVAGHDTTATGLSWALERLTRHPTALAKAVAAADASAAGDPSGDEYLDAVCKETLRVRPVVFDIGRVLTRPVDLAGYRLPAGVMVAPGAGLVHANPEPVPQPGEVRPGSDARGTSLAHHMAPVRGRQPTLSGRNVRAHRDAGGVARDPAAGRPRRHHGGAANASESST